MRELQRLLNATFKPARRPDPHRKAREEAKRLAAELGVEIEQLKPGFNVWPPKSWQGADPLEGDHYCSDWGEVLTAVNTYKESA